MFVSCSDEILQASDDLNQVFDKYKTVIVEGKPIENKATNHSLLDLDGIDLQTNTTNLSTTTSESKEIDVLCDVFSSTGIEGQPSVAGDFLLPLVASKHEELVPPQHESKVEQQTDSKLKALEELDLLSEHLLKENLHPSKKLGQQFNKCVKEKLAFE